MGKTLAEANLKIAGTYLSQYFNFELLDKKRYGPKDSYPRSHSFMNGTMPIMVRLTEYNKQGNSVEHDSEYTTDISTPMTPYGKMSVS